MSTTIVMSRIGAHARIELERRKRMVAMKVDAERDLLAFIRMMWPVLEPMQPLVEGWVLDLLCDVLMGISFKSIWPPRVCINVPPGSTKSTLLNVLWPAWEWGPLNRPSIRYLSASYSTDVPARDNLRFATIIKHPVYQQCWGDHVKVTRDGAEWVSNDRTGWKMITSVSGGTTGFRGDRLLLDDLNNPQSVESELVRRTTNRFVREIMPDRLNSLEDSAIINLQQRTHQSDATGTLLEHGQGYTFVCVPMRFDALRIFPVVLSRDEDNNPVDVWVDPRSLDADGRQLPGLTTNDRGEPAVIPGSPMDRATGESCWPERFGEDALTALEMEKGPYAWCNPAWAPVLMADLTVKPIEMVRVGDEVVGFETDCEPRREGEKWARRRLVRTTVRQVHENGKRPVVYVTLDSGARIVCTPDHRWYTGRSPTDPTHPLYAPAKLGRPLMRVCDPTPFCLDGKDDWFRAGWLGGFYEGEGSVCAQSRREGDATNAVISFAQTDGANLPICEQLERVLSYFGFEWGMSLKPREEGHQQLRMYWLKRGGLPTYQKFLHIAKPIKWRDRIIEAAYGSSFIRSEEKVVKIEDAGETDVYGLTTDTGNYVVWGIASSNSGQYQQYPGVRGGSIVRRDWWKLWDDTEFPEVGTVLVSLDTAVETKEINDYTAATKWGAFEGRDGEPLLILLSAWRARLPLAEMVREVHAMCMGRGEVRDASAAKADYLLIEDKQQGRAVHDELLRLQEKSPWQTEMIKPRGDKIARLQAVSHLFSGDAKRLPDGKDEHGKDKFIDVFMGGMIYAPNRQWADEVISEVADFPYSAHDDWTDTVSQALNWVRQNGVILRKEEWSEAEYERNLYRKPLTVPYSIRREG